MILDTKLIIHFSKKNLILLTHILILKNIKYMIYEWYKENEWFWKSKNKMLKTNMP